MKKLLLVMCVLFIASCSKDEICDCTKTSYETEEYNYYENGQFKTGTRTVVLDNTSVDCDTPEGRTKTSETTYYVIACK
tara:strand:- start:2001 stop:2237 length:237 start_codon:yes stop_codon:yes gene_type:complete